MRAALLLAWVMTGCAPSLEEQSRRDLLRLIEVEDEARQAGPAAARGRVRIDVVGPNAKAVTVRLMPQRTSD